MLLVRVRNSPRSIKKNSNMNPRLSGYISILGICNFCRMFRYRTQLLVPVPPEC